jgi:hypothetical protein
MTATMRAMIVCFRLAAHSLIKDRVKYLCHLWIFLKPAVKSCEAVRAVNKAGIWVAGRRLPEDSSTVLQSLPCYAEASNVFGSCFTGDRFT